MLCSRCNKNTAVVFVNRLDENKKQQMQGLCYNCAKELGINPLEALAKQANLSQSDLEDMTSQFENMFQDMSENMSEEELNELMSEGEDGLGEISPDSLGSIFSGLFGFKNSGSGINENETSADSSAKSDKKVKEKENKKQNKKKKALDTFGTNLTNKAKNNQLDSVIGRDREIQRIIQILNRRSKNNPCLIGEPGVGKTAIAQGLAIKIANGNVPAKLLNKEVYLLDMTSVIAGTQFRGQFEARMKSIIDECKNLGNIILVIDEIHNIIGAGDAEHSMNAANILKPSL